ncbi:MAG: hypothetical protein AB1445_00610 [Bacillota bacterium]
MALTGVCVKIVDDAIDRDLDMAMGRPGLLASLEGSAPAYACAALAVATMLNFQDAVSLFIACYVVGMAHNPCTRLRWGGRAWHESTLLMVTGMAVLGLLPMLAALSLAVAVQVCDQLLDQRDRSFGGRAGWLPAEKVVATGFLWGLGLGLDPLKALGVMLATVTLWLAEGAWRGREDR